MAVLTSLNVLGNMRLDVPMLRMIESGVSGDFDVLAGRYTAGSKPLIVRGFSLLTTASSIGAAAGNLQVSVADGIMVNVNATENGSLFWVASDVPAESLGSGDKVVGAFTSSTINYVGLDIVKLADSATSDIVKFIDSNSTLETSRTVPLRRTLQYRFIISTTPFSSQSTVAPLAIVTTDASNNVTAIQDARNLAFRLGSGGDVPNPLNYYAFPTSRTELTTPGNEFSGADKGFTSLKDATDAMMTRIWEVGGGEHWYSATADRNVTMVYTGSPYTNGEQFEVVSSNVHWKGLRFLFDNSTGYYNDVSAQNTSSAGLTDIADGECIYVDLDRTQNATVTGKKGVLSTLGPGSVPGSRYIIVWRSGSTYYTRGWKYPIGATFTPATATSTGVVELSRNDTATPLTPVVISREGGTITPSAAVIGSPALTINAGPYNGDTALRVLGGAGGASLGQDAAIWASGGSVFGTTYTSTTGTGNIGIYAASTGVSIALRAVSNGGVVVGSVNGTPIQGISGSSAAPGVYGLSGSSSYGVHGQGRDAAAASGAAGAIGLRGLGGVGDGIGNGGIGASIQAGGSGSGATGNGGIGLQVTGGTANSTNGVGGTGVTGLGGVSTSSNPGGAGGSFQGGQSPGDGGTGLLAAGGTANGTNTTGSKAFSALGGAGLGTGSGGLGIIVFGGTGGATNTTGGAGIQTGGGSGGGSSGSGGNGINATGAGGNTNGAGGGGVVAAGGSGGTSSGAGGAGIIATAGGSGTGSGAAGAGGLFYGAATYTSPSLETRNSAGVIATGTFAGAGVIGVGGDGTTNSTSQYTDWAALAGRLYTGAGVIGLALQGGIGMLASNTYAGTIGSNDLLTLSTATAGVAVSAQMANIVTELASATAATSYGFRTRVFRSGTTQFGVDSHIAGQNTNSIAGKFVTDDGGYAATFSATMSTRGTINIAARSGGAPGIVPQDGDIWYDGTDIKMRIGVTTKTFTLV